MRVTFPFEITKFFDTKIDIETGKREIILKKNYAFAVEENFKAIKKYFNELIDTDNIIPQGLDASIVIKTGSIGSLQIEDESITPEKLSFDIMSSDWSDWTPDYGVAGGAMTFTNVNTFVAKYCKLGGIVFFTIHFSGTTGGNPAPYLRFTLPIVGVDSKFGGACRNLDIGNNSRVGVWYNAPINGNNRIVVAHGDSSDWTLGLSRGAIIQGFYRV